MSRMTIYEIDKFIEKLSKTEEVDGYTERMKRQAIAYLNNYNDALEEKSRKSVKLIAKM